jgi:NitT/TauT family transport system substrate-binding protein/putative hydroxymethylpyrimidine transport system substrate-binding protein
MRLAVALLAAVLALAGGAGCGAGAEPGAPNGATLLLDFTPNAVHSGIYAAERRGFYNAAGVDLQVREPGDPGAVPKLLAAGRTDFAILDIHDLGIAREQGLDIVGAMAIVQRPLAAVIAPTTGPVDRPRELVGRTVGVTGLPSDEAVVDSEVRGDGGDPEKVHRVTIGFNAVSALAAGRVDAATGFWNAESVALARRGVPNYAFRVNRYGAPPYPELILTASQKTIDEDPGLVDAMVEATTRGYRFAYERPAEALDDLLASVPSLDRGDQAAQLRLLRPDLEPAPLDQDVLDEWAAWDLEHGLLEHPLDVEAAFRLPG